MTETIILTIASIGFMTLLCQWLAWKVQLPAILFLLLTGIVLGPVTGLLQPDKLLGHLLFPIVNISAAIILFEGSLTLNLRQIKTLKNVIRNLLSIGVLITIILTVSVSHFVLGLHWSISALLGAITSVTGPTVITPMLRTIRPNSNISEVLRFEGIMVDPIGVIMAILVLGVISSYHGQQSYMAVGIELIELLFIAGCVGLLLGYGLGHALRRHIIPDYLNNIAVLTLVVSAYAIANLVDEGSGLLTVTIMGITLANMSQLYIKDIIGFKESLSLLLISGLFILLSARLELTSLQEVLLPSLILLACLQFVIRPIVVFCCTRQSTLTWQEKFMVSWIAPRGIIAAAVAALFAIRLKQIGITQTHFLVPVTFIIIIGTVVFQCLTSGWLARQLKVQAPANDGFLIIGANAVAIAIGQVLSNHGIRNILASSSWREIQQAKMANLQTYYGNPTSTHADRHLSLIGIGRCLAVSGNEQINTLACLRYGNEFGKANVFYLKAQKTHLIEKHSTARRHLGRLLFSNAIEHKTLNQAIEQGGQLKSTQLTKQFSFEQFQKQHPAQLPLFLINGQGQIIPFTTDTKLQAKAQDHIISLKLDQ